MRLTVCIGAGLVAASLSAPAASATSSVAWSEASIRDFNYSVFDFRPDDGIAAQVTWLSGSTSADASWGGIDLDEVNVIEQARHLSRTSVFDPGALKAYLPSGQATGIKAIDGDMTASVVVDRAVFDEPIGWGYRSSAFGPVLGAHVTTEEQEFRLAPGTEMTLSGQYHVAATVDAEPLRGWSFLDVQTSSTRAVSINASSNAYSYIVTSYLDDIEVVRSSQANNIYLKAYQHITKAGPGNRSTAQDQEDLSFSYVLRNNGNAPGRFWLTASASTGFSAHMAAVPEPTVWGLAVVGLLMVAGLGRRRLPQP